MAFLDLFFPKKCVNCGRWGRYVCADCEVGLWEEQSFRPAGSGLEAVICLWAYAGIAQKIITAAKYRFYYDLISELISHRPLPSLPPVDAVIPIPLHPRRERERGFNQAEIIARLISAATLIPTVRPLVRTRDTGRQVGRTRTGRLQNVSGAFAIRDSSFANHKSALLVDDVWTTGATMSECAQVLKRHGIQKVWGLVLAK